jgi:hypothetical protein
MELETSQPGAAHAAPCGGEVVGGFCVGEDEAERFRQLQLDMLRSENKHLDVRLDELTVALHSKLPPMEPLAPITPFGSPGKPQLQAQILKSQRPIIFTLAPLHSADL